MNSKLPNENHINFEVYYLKYRRLVYSIVHASSAPSDFKEDLIQDLFLHLFETISKINQGRYLPHDESKYIKTALRNELQRLLYSAKGITSNESLISLDIISDNDVRLPQSDRMAEIYYDEQIQMIRSALSEKEFIIFELYFINEFSASEISKFYRCSSQAIYKTIKKIKNKLEIVLKNA